MESTFTINDIAIMKHRPFLLKRLFFAAIFLGGFLMPFFIPSDQLFAQGEPIENNGVLIEVLERDDCGHCERQRIFLTDLEKEISGIQVVYHDIKTPAGEALFHAVTARAKTSKSTPLTLIGSTLLQGFEDVETTGIRIRTLVEAERGKPQLGFEGYLAGATLELEKSGLTCDSVRGICEVPSPEPLLVKIPFIGPTDVSAYSLPTMAAVLGLIDGFNPCAMWVLVTFLIVLVQMANRERMLAVAGLFIVAETVMYYLILNVWFTTWDFIGLDQWVTPIVGMVSLGGGLFFLYEWYHSDGTCQVTNLEQRAKISSRIKKLATEPFTWLTAGGVIVLAFSVNVIEFACSIGIPQAFTKIVELNELTWLHTQGLMALYILGYMVDDFLVFGLALWGFEKLHLTAQYSKWSNLIGGILMLLLGALLIFAPEALRFV